ncbi:MAG TPA: hypothetical protein VN408_36930, partial [Actinoplanes sp.]|nr:hypothetical protein [Actinoplanes sp.]
ADQRALLATVRPWLAETAPDVTAERFLREIEATGLLLSPGPRQYTFTHQTFQEYLAARHIAEEGLDDLLPEMVDDPWWGETILLYAAGNDPNPIVRSALDSDTLTARALAFRIDESGARVDPALQATLEAVLHRGLQAGARTADRILAVNVLIGQMLRRMVFTPEGTRVGRRPVTTELYQLFCSDTGTPFVEGPEPADPETPARGIWRDDAKAFVDWVNGMLRSGPDNASDVTFRLPTRAEIATVRPAHPLWVSAGGSIRFWSPDGRRNEVTAAVLTTALAADLDGSRLLDRGLNELAVRGAAAVPRRVTYVKTVADDLFRTVRELGRVSSSSSPEALREEELLQARAVDTVKRLESSVQQVQAAVLALHEVLSVLPGLGQSQAQLVRNILGHLDLEPVHRCLDVADGNGAVRRSLRRAKIRADLRKVPDLVKQCLDVANGLRPPAGRASRIDSMLTPVDYEEIRLPLPESTAEPVRAVAAALLPAEADRFRISLSSLADRVGFMSRRAGRLPVDHDFLEALERLVRVAAPLVRRDELITAGSAAAIRAPALVLARFAQRAGGDRLSTDLIELAAATCLLEPRRTHPEHLEALLLAHD